MGIVMQGRLRDYGGWRPAGQPLSRWQPHLVSLAERVLDETTVAVRSGHDTAYRLTRTEEAR
jgi:hypothetical protein